MAERGPSGAVASRGIGGSGRPVSVASSFSQSEGGRISTRISFGSLGKERVVANSTNRFSTPFSTLPQSSERSMGTPNPIKSGLTATGLSDLIGQKPYEGMFGGSNFSSHTESTPVSLIKKTNPVDAAKSVESVRSFIKELPGREIVSQIPEQQPTPTRALHYPTWGRSQVEQSSRARIAEVRQDLQNISTGENVSHKKVAGTEWVASESRPVVENKPNSGASYGALLTKKEERKSGHPENRQIGDVLADIRQLGAKINHSKTPWMPVTPNTVDIQSVQQNTTHIGTAGKNETRSRASVLLLMMTEREEKKNKAKAKLAQRGDRKNEKNLEQKTDTSIATPASSLESSPKVQSAAEVGTGVSKNPIQAEKNKYAFKKAVVPGITQKDKSTEAYPYKVDNQARKERVKQWSNAVKRVFPFFNFTFSVPLREVAHALDHANQATQSALIRQTGGSKDGSDIEWRNAVQVDTAVTKGEAYLAGIAAIDTRPPVILGDEGLDVKEKDVRLVLDGENKDDAQPMAEAA